MCHECPSGSNYVVWFIRFCRFHNGILKASAVEVLNTFATEVRSTPYLMDGGLFASVMIKEILIKAVDGMVVLYVQSRALSATNSTASRS